MRVLIFDNDAAVGRMLVRLANVSGIDAMAVTTEAAFHQSLRNDPPQVIILEMQLSGTDGVEQLRWLADQKFGGALVLMSGYDSRVLSTAGTLGQRMGLHIERLMEKPLQLEDLEQVLDRLRSGGKSPTAAQLRAAIANNEMSLDFQPVVSRAPRKLKKLEALIRWDHPHLGRIPPGDFLRLAESDQPTIDALTDWVVGGVVKAYRMLADFGVSVPLAVNISTQNLHDLTLPDRLDRILRAGGMPAHHLSLEITEHAALKHAVLTMDILSRLRLKGVHLSIDEFGIGYSSLNLLRQMPFSEVKIDRSFISDAASSRHSMAIAKSIIELAGNLEIGCVAAGVENEETAALLERLGACDLQGYLIAPPMSVEAIPGWLAAWLQTAPQETQSGAAPSPATQRPVQSAPLPLMQVQPSRPALPDVRLSPRQGDVMRLLSEGCSVKDIARRLNLGIGTVKVHLSLAYSALGARNRIEAIRRAGMIGQAP